MGQLLLIAVNRKLDLEYVLTYPLTPVPLSMCNYDGTLAKTDKSTLFRELEKMVNGETLTTPSLDAYVIDGNFLLHLLPNKISPTYGGLASTILIMATSTTSKRVDLLFDTYKEPSIKDCERQRRGAEEQEFVITGPDQLRPRNLSDALKSTSFKKNLPSFLIEEWKKLHYSTIIKDCHLYVGHLNQCHHFFVENHEVRHECIATMESNHEEADTMICFHAKVIDETEHPGHIVDVADTAFITCELSAADGWYLKDSHYHINWFDGCQMPERLIPDDMDETVESDDELILAAGSSDESNADE
ncbi:hypothetical protein LOTGIDRAFT_164355 [Lottia gigantea]|uniref:Uncharacterized protein n=1 Tax=Lottia gigantea TaxID=225164 RepID=V4A077_LOTGI|nr:hypothetical protein LOTGIDRAFT_164355 [Lottia gigantea]ESO90052.1 hypothetical protein LOTGIDRAFT_164355 [Lottia gigantea]